MILDEWSSVDNVEPYFTRLCIDLNNVEASQSSTVYVTGTIFDSVPRWISKTVLPIPIESASSLLMKHSEVQLTWPVDTRGRQCAVYSWHLLRIVWGCRRSRSCPWPTRRATTGKRTLPGRTRTSWTNPVLHLHVVNNILPLRTLWQLKSSGCCPNETWSLQNWPQDVLMIVGCTLYLDS